VTVHVEHGSVHPHRSGHAEDGRGSNEGDASNDGEANGETTRRHRAIPSRECRPSDVAQR